jgi:hypothetical protein
VSHRLADRAPIPAAAGDEVIDLPTQINPKRRKCLRCLEHFESQWAGERVCGRCKRSSTWRSGEPTAPPSTRARG